MNHVKPGEKTRQAPAGPRGLGGPGTDRPPLDFSTQPDLVWVVAEGHRLAYGHLYNPTWATEIAQIDPLPHQRLAVYDRMLPQPRLRFLLADDAGAGKTIMAGLYIREMLSRGLLRRVLVVPPAGLVPNWERELRTLFNLRFRIITGSDSKSENPFIGPDSDLLIVSVDTLDRRPTFARLQEPEVVPYDLVLFDEAHKLSADREPDLSLRRTDRYRLAEALAGVPREDPCWQLPWSPRHLLLLTATPHMGKDFPYYCLWRLLEPEVLSTEEAFRQYPPEARRQHFLRRTKEEMVHLDGRPLYPERRSDTLSYHLTQGPVSEQTLYDETTRYLEEYYSRSLVLNRAAVRLAMSIFQRRVASSTYAVIRSFERRLEKLDDWIEALRSGRLNREQMVALQRGLEVVDVWESKTADEESAEAGREENELAEEKALAAVAGVALEDLEEERQQVQTLLHLARQVYQAGQESKFEKLQEVLSDPRYQDQKLILFTEYRDTLDFLVKRLEAMGFTGRIAQIHGGMPAAEREQQVEFFRQPVEEGGAVYLIATDAAGEGINLQFCWLMVNYDIPWNPARLEQRMGRIHRYGQQHDPVIIVNLVAGQTREGRVLKTLLEKLELIRRELRSDKVFDVIGRLFEGVSLRDYLERALSEEGARQAERELGGRLTPEQVRAIEERERRLYGDGGDVKRELPRINAELAQGTYARLLPGYVRRFVERTAPLLDLSFQGDLDGEFGFRELRPGALVPLWPVLQTYSPEQRRRLTLRRPERGSDRIWLHPGQALFDLLREYVCSRFAEEALRGAVFVDPTATEAYLFHLVEVSVVGQVGNLPHPLDRRLVGLRQHLDGRLETCPVEQLLLLSSDRSLTVAVPLGGAVQHRDREGAVPSSFLQAAFAYAVEQVARPLAAEKRRALEARLPEREAFLRSGYAYQEAELAAIRSRLTKRLQSGDQSVSGALTVIKNRQRALGQQREEALAVLRREPELIEVEEVRFLAHALVVPSSDPEERRRQEQEVEAIAMRLAWEYEKARGSVVRDVSTPEKARAAGLSEWPGFDLLSCHPNGEVRSIEVKGRAGIGEVELSENEWAKACNLRERYWLYVAFECASAHPRLLCVQDPFGRLVARPKGGVIVDEQEIFKGAWGG